MQDLSFKMQDLSFEMQDLKFQNARFEISKCKI